MVPLVILLRRPVLLIRLILIRIVLLHLHLPLPVLVLKVCDYPLKLLERLLVLVRVLILLVVILLIMLTLLALLRLRPVLLLEFGMRVRDAVLEILLRPGLLLLLILRLLRPDLLLLRLALVRIRILTMIRTMALRILLILLLHLMMHLIMLDVPRPDYLDDPGWRVGRVNAVLLREIRPLALLILRRAFHLHILRISLIRVRGVLIRVHLSIASRLHLRMQMLPLLLLPSEDVVPELLPSLHDICDYLVYRHQRGPLHAGLKLLLSPGHCFDVILRLLRLFWRMIHDDR